MAAFQKKNAALRHGSYLAVGKVTEPVKASSRKCLNPEVPLPLQRATFEHGETQAASAYSAALH